MLSQKILSAFSKSIHLLQGRVAKIELQLGYNPSPSPFGIATTTSTVQLAQEKKASSSQELEISSQFDESLFKRIDMRVGKIVEVEDNPASTSAFYEKVDIGEPELRSIATGVKGKIPIEEVTGLVCVCSNLKKKKIGPEFYSHGMLMCAGEDGKFEFLRPPKGSKVGERIFVQGVKFESQQYLKPLNNQKYLKRYLQLLKTNEECEGCFAGMVLKTSAGVVKVESMKNTNIS